MNECLLDVKAHNPKAQRPKSSKTQKLKNSKTQKLKNSKTQKLKNSKAYALVLIGRTVRLRWRRRLTFPPLRRVP
ncbi:hypothetical protein, partial [Pseudomonas putida]|uniref:hypothetical protein n=1 Tax=Pseudomonas putida TaxID=303 RepID=UPI00346764D8